MASQKQNQSAGTSRDPQDPRALQCTSTKDDLLKKPGRYVDDFCPICGDYGKQVRVGAHPSAPTGGGIGGDPSVAKSVWPIMVPTLVNRVMQELPMRNHKRARAEEEEVSMEVEDKKDDAESVEDVRKKRKLWKAQRIPIAVDAAVEAPQVPPHASQLQGSGPVAAPDVQDPVSDSKQQSLVPSPASQPCWYLGRDVSKLFIRQCTTKCFDFIWKTVGVGDVRRAALCTYVVFVVTGPPGLGKSWSSNAFVWMLLRHGQNLWFHSASHRTLTLIRFDKGIPVVTERPENEVMALHPPEGTWFLYDSVGGSDTSTMIPFQSQPAGVYCIIFSSPKDTNYKQGTKIMMGGVLLHLWMPVWELFELEAVIPSWHQEFLLGSERSLEDFRQFIQALYSIWGGVPRKFAEFIPMFRLYGLQSALAVAEQKFVEEISNVSHELMNGGAVMTNQMLDCVHSGPVSNASSRERRPPSWLVLPCPLESAAYPFMLTELKFCSRRAEYAFLERVEQMETDAVLRFCKDVFKTGAARGVAFERFAHFVLTRTELNNFRYQKYNAQGQPARSSRLVLPKCKALEPCEMVADMTQFIASIVTCVQSNDSVVIQPKSDQQDAIDMFVVFKPDAQWRVLAMQDTISRTHSFHPVKILEYRNAALTAFESLGMGQAVGEDFFQHVVVVPDQAGAEESALFRLKPASTTKLSSTAMVQAKFGQCRLELPQKWPKRWTKDFALSVCRAANAKKYSTLSTNELQTTAAVCILLAAASDRVTSFTWMLDGFWQTGASASSTT